MTGLNRKQDEKERRNPVEGLQTLLAADMDAVNAMIIARMDSPVPMIPQLAGYLIAAGGKRIRPLMTLAASKLFGADMTRAHRLAAAVEFIHTATLLHDDVVDASDERRGKKSANAVFGNEASVLVGDFLFSRAFQLMVEDGNLDVLKTLSDASAIIAQGEVLQLSTQGDLATDMDAYLDVIKGKTAALFAAACEVGPLVAGSDENAVRIMAEYGMNLGIAFQIADDLLDYNADRAKLGKAVGDDFREGKMTAPIIIALQKANDEERAFWQRTLAERDQNDSDLIRAQSILARHGALEAGLDLARHYCRLAREALAEAPDSPLRALLDSLAVYTVERSF
ncbi:MAG: polyprenyl synthetase family protein [Micavibrio sp.]